MAVELPENAVQIWPLVPTRSFDDPLTYLVASDKKKIAAGALVEIPLGNKTRLGVVQGQAAAVPDGVTLKHVKSVVEGISIHPPLLALATDLAQQYGCAVTRAIAMMVPPSLASQSHAAVLMKGRTVSFIRRVGRDGGEELSKRQSVIFDGIPEEWTPVSKVLSNLGTTRSTVQKIVEKSSSIEIEEREVESGVGDGLDQYRSRVTVSPPQLTADQLAAINMCMEADPAALLAGITGSGKTEVYLGIIDRIITQESGSAIVLVPEIALTPQTSARFTDRFPGRVEVLHSAMSKSRKTAAWHRIASGAIDVVVGPRSAVFAPLRNLRAIIIDEEHDSSYKQESEPRYDARRIAWRRAQIEGARVVYGTATPRPETWHGVKRRARLMTRPRGGTLAPVEVVDLKDHADEQPLTTPLLAGIDAALNRGAKAMVLQNRRGYANAAYCQACGETRRCTACDVAMVIHGDPRGGNQRLMCHHCSRSVPLADRCPSCSAGDIVRMGAGSQRVERLLAERYPDHTVIRLDADAGRSHDAITDIIDEFRQPGPAILVGTQMIAKGHDFPDVELAAIVNADVALAIPDFRAEERAFMLVTQLAGRAGRTKESARQAHVVVQAWQTDARYLRYAVNHDIEGFLADELDRRKEYGYPPFCRLVRIVLSAPNERLFAGWAQGIAEGLRSMEVGTVLGPTRLLRINNRDRVQVLVKTRNPGPVVHSYRAFMRRNATAASKQNIRVVIDVDPQNLI